MREGLITVSRSPWASPILLVPKKDGFLHLCMDYRKLSAVPHPDPFPMPRFEDLIDGLAGADYITTLDLTIHVGYGQVPVAQEARGKTAFTMPFVKHEFYCDAVQFGVGPIDFLGVSASSIGCHSRRRRGKSQQHFSASKSPEFCQSPGHSLAVAFPPPVVPADSIFERIAGGPDSCVPLQPCSSSIASGRDRHRSQGGLPVRCWSSAVDADRLSGQLCHLPSHQWSSGLP